MGHGAVWARVPSRGHAVTARIPCTVIGGFLGAGKTTLLNHLLRSQPGCRLAVLVNDFGALNVDAALVASTEGDTVALTNGCVCCTIGDDLSAALIRVLSADPPFDGVVIEASGVSDPWRIAQLGMAASELRLDGVIVLVDAGAVLEQVADPLLADALHTQIRAADLLVLNKVDLVDDAQRTRVRDWLNQIAPRTPVYETVQAEVPLPVLSSTAMTEPCHHRCQHGECSDHAHEVHHTHGAVFDTWSQQPQAVLSVSALARRLEALPNEVLRLKGWVRTKEHGWSEVQLAGRRVSVRRVSEAPTQGAGWVAIGLHGRLPTDALDQLGAPDLG